MKLLKVFGVLFLAVLVVFFGTEYFLGDHAGKNDGEAVVYYQERVKQLENDLAMLKSEKYASKTAYQKRIAELEGLLAGSQGEYTYEINEDKVTVTQYKGTAKNVSVPSVIDGKPVVVIGREAFRNTGVESVILPDSVETIGWFAFWGCHRLGKITISSGVKKIDYGAFEGCPSLTIICEKESFAEKYAKSYGIRTEQK